ncbi:MAG: efflux RND transporter periplasmic adaptor subunit [Rhodanobacter sp.]
MQTAATWKIGAAVVVVGLGIYLGHSWLAGSSNDPAKAAATAASPDSVTITDQQAQHVMVEPVRTHDFDQQRDAVGYIDFDQDHLAQVFSPYQGRVRQVLAQAGDDVTKGQLLFTIDSPDLAQAEANLISTAGLLAQTDKALERARKMITIQANAQKDVEQATSDQQTADGNYRAARDALRIFGLSDAEMDRIAASRKVDGVLPIVSPFAGRVTARTIAPGTLVQAGSTPAPFTVADLSTVWGVANVSEDDVSALQLGQVVSVTIAALPGHTLQGKVSYIGSASDPNTHRIMVRTEIRDSSHQLHPQMLANFVIRTGQPVHSAAVPLSALVREGDGTMTVFTTQDGHRFTRRSVKLGQQQDGLDQILDGLSVNERVAGDGALFLSSALALQSSQ